MILDKDIAFIPTPQEIRYHLGKVVGLHLTFSVKYQDIVFSTECEWEVPEDRQCYAEHFEGERRNAEMEECMKQTQIQMKTLEKVIDHRRQHES